LVSKTQKSLLGLTPKINKIKALKMRELSKQTTPSMDRKARTRTLIQLGGLLEKLNLPEIFGLELGDDLQDYDTNWNSACLLIGFLEQAKSTLLPQDEIPDTLFETWHKTGERILKG
jgi:hypothetical protein